jgi:hypothetical protein
MKSDIKVRSSAMGIYKKFHFRMRIKKRSSEQSLERWYKMRQVSWSRKDSLGKKMVRAKNWHLVVPAVRSILFCLVQLEVKDQSETITTIQVRIRESLLYGQ